MRGGVGWGGNILFNINKAFRKYDIILYISEVIIRYGLVVRIVRFHRIGHGSIPCIGIKYI